MKKIILSTAVTAALVLPAILVNGDAIASSVDVHPDCIDNEDPARCSRIVERLELELADYTAAHIAGDVDAMASYFVSPGAIVSVYGDFYRGNASYKDDCLAPLFGDVITSADFDWSGVRWQVISPDLVVQYGSPSATFTYADGSTSTFLERMIMVWTRSDIDPNKPFVVATAMYELF